MGILYLFGDILCEILCGELGAYFETVFFDYREGDRVTTFERRKEWEERMLCPPS
jgi:hypothetical protein